MDKQLLLDLLSLAEQQILTSAEQVRLQDETIVRRLHGGLDVVFARKVLAIAQEIKAIFEETAVRLRQDLQFLQDGGANGGT